MVLSATDMLSEPLVVSDIFVSGLAHLEDLGDGNHRAVFYARQKSVYGEEEFIVVARLILPTNAILDGVKTVMTALGKKCCGAVAERLRVTH